MHSQPRDESIYSTISKNNNNPYDKNNFQIYGEVVKINMEDKAKY